MDEARLTRLVHDHGAFLLAFLVYRTGDSHLAEDLVADTFERALTAKRPYDPRRGSRRAWLTTIALNAYRDHLRRAAVERRHLETLDPPVTPDVAESAIMRRSLLSALSELPPDERETLALVYGADLSARRVAELLEVPVTTVQGRVYRGLRRLREQLDEDGPGTAAGSG